MRQVVLFVALAVSACSPKLAFNNEAGGVIDTTGVAGNDRAYAMATEHCAKYGKIARMGARDTLTAKMTFDCVAKE